MLLVPDFAKVPGGTTGLLCRDLRCKDAQVYKVDTGLLAERRAHAQQAAQELSQRRARSAVEEPNVIDVTPVSMTLAMVMTAAELEELHRARTRDLPLAAPGFVARYAGNHTRRMGSAGIRRRRLVQQLCKFPPS